MNILLVLVILLSFASIYLYKKPEDNLQKRIDDIIAQKIQEQEFLIERDRKVQNDSFSPPERRVPKHEYPFGYIRDSSNIPTRGYPDTYQIVGVLIRDETEQVFNLYGRQKYPGSNQWEYYASGNAVNNYNFKVPLDISGDKELDDGDAVLLPGTDQTKGEFIVKKYDYDVPRYIPVIY